MKPWIRSAAAPGYEVVIFTTVFDKRGYCRIGNTVAARKPIKRISRLTTTESTGRLMKISVQIIGQLRSLNSRARDEWRSVARRFRRNRRRRIGRDRDRSTGLQLQLADRDHAVARLEP